MELKDFQPIENALYTCKNGNQRYIHCVTPDEQINFSIPGLMTMMPMYCSVEEFYQWGKENTNG